MAVIFMFAENDSCLGVDCVGRACVDGFGVNSIESIMYVAVHIFYSVKVTSQPHSVVTPISRFVNLVMSQFHQA